MKKIVALLCALLLLFSLSACAKPITAEQILGEWYLTKMEKGGVEEQHEKDWYQSQGLFLYAEGKAVMVTDGERIDCLYKLKENVLTLMVPEWYNFEVSFVLSFDGGTMITAEQTENGATCYWQK